VVHKERKIMKVLIDMLLPAYATATMAVLTVPLNTFCATFFRILFAVMYKTPAVPNQNTASSVSLYIEYISHHVLKAFNYLSPLMCWTIKR
jgi:hypothetical protein